MSKWVALLARHGLIEARSVVTGPCHACSRAHRWPRGLEAPKMTQLVVSRRSNRARKRHKFGGHQDGDYIYPVVDGSVESTVYTDPARAYPQHATTMT